MAFSKAIDEELADGEVAYGDGNPFQTVFVFQMRDGLIAHETAY